jgi:hypothetical protein
MALAVGYNCPVLGQYSTLMRVDSTATMKSAPELVRL